MTLKNEYINYDAIGLAELIRNKLITPQELMQAVLERSEKINPLINAIQYPDYEEALQKAAKIDINLPLAGVPFLLKDLGVMQKGKITSGGCRFYQDFIAPVDSEIVKRYEQMGLNIFGKTSSAEIGMSYATDTELYGACKNPWDLNLTPGGSSGGAAAVVAARIIPVAHASDGGGSIRVPAACCGLFGLKPTRARIPCGPMIGEAWSGLATSHVISHSVRDSAFILNHTAGPELGDPYHAPMQHENYFNNLDKPLKPLKIALAFPNIHSVQLTPECANAAKLALKICEQLGHHIIDKPFNYDFSLLDKAIDVIIAANLAMNISLRSKALGREPTKDDISNIILLIIEQGRQYSAADYAEALMIMHHHSRKIAAYFIDIDVLITPTIAKLPVPIGTLNKEQNDIEKHYQDLLAFAPYTSIWNQTGQPAMSVPIYWTEQNIPVGAQFIAKFGAEDILLQLARQFEIANPWANKIPFII